MFDLPNLWELYLYCTQLQTIPSTIQNAFMLMEITIKSDRLTEVPDELWDLPNILYPSISGFEIPDFVRRKIDRNQIRFAHLLVPPEPSNYKWHLWIKKIGRLDILDALREKSQYERIQINEIDTQEFIEIGGKVTKVRDSLPYYMSCNRCAKEVQLNDEGQYECRTHGPVAKPVPHMRVSILMDDGTSSIWAVMLGKTAEMGTNLPADYVFALNTENTEQETRAKEIVRKSLEGKELLLRGKATLRPYEKDGEVRERVELLVNRVLTPDPMQEINSTQVYEQIQINEIDTQELIIVRAKVTKVSDSLPYYMGCNRCAKELQLNDEGQYECRTHGPVAKPVPHMRVSMLLDDSTGTLWAVMLGKTAEIATNLTAKDVFALNTEDTEQETKAKEIVRKSLEGKELLLGGKATLRPYEKDGEVRERVELLVNRVLTPDPMQEIKE